MKKIIICVISICILLAGCGEKQMATVENTSKKVTENRDEKVNAAKDGKNRDKEAYYLLSEGKKLVLKNLMNNKVVNKYQLTKKQCANSMIKLDTGYCVRIYEANRELKNRVIQGVTVDDTPDENEIVKVSMKFFDKKLHEIDTVDVSKLAEERKNEDLLMMNYAVSPDGSKIAWDIGEYILCYDRGTKQYTEYNQITKKDIIATNITFTGNDKLAFYGSEGESGEDTCYGYLNLPNKKVHFFIEKKYEAFSLNADERYIWLNDGENPKDGKASGKVPVIDTKTGKNYIVHLDNIESAKARITKDGKCLIAVSQIEEKSFRVRQYDIESKRILSEKKYDFSQLVHVDDIIPINDVKSKSYGIIYGTDKGTKLEVFELK